MRKHPSLAEVLESKSDYEWLTINVSGFTVGDFVDSENEKGSVSAPHLRLLSRYSESDSGTISYNNGVVEVSFINNDDLQSLKGEKPIGSINYYDPEYTGVSININKVIYEHIVNCLVSSGSGVTLKVAFPLLENSEIKCLPLMKYQIVCKRENEI